MFGRTLVLTLFLTGVMVAQVPQNGLVAYYPFDGDANDASGNGYHGNVIGATFTNDRFGGLGKAIWFDGNGSFVDVPGTEAMNFSSGGLSISAWIRLDGSQSPRAIVSKHIAGYVNGYTLAVTDYGLEFFLGNYNYAAAKCPTTLGSVWHHVVGTYDDATAKIYFDGTLAGSASLSYGPMNSTTIKIGSYNTPGFPLDFVGAIDQVRIYSRALNEAEIGSLYNEEIPPMPLLVSLYLHGTGATANPAVLTFNALAPLGTTPKYKDSPGIKFSGGNVWQLVGVWNASAGSFVGDLARLGNLRTWIGLKNSDDIGTNFDLRAELWKNSLLVTAGETYGIKGVTRNPDLAKEVMVAFGSFENVQITSADVVSLKILTRIGTDGAGNFLGGHSNAVGLRLYFDAVSRSSTFEAEFWLAQSSAQDELISVTSRAEAVNKELLGDGKFPLLESYPNPFNPSTTIMYRVAEQARIVIEVYSSLGQLVRKLVDEERDPGVYSVIWDGRNRDGVAVSSGVYFCNVKAGANMMTRRILLLK